MTGIRAFVEWILRAVFDVAKPLVERIASVGLIQSGVVLAAQTFMALFPLLIAITALAPSGVSDTIAETLRHRLGLDAEATDQMQHLVSGRSDLQGGITAIGLIVVLASATSFTRALQRVYENAWQLPRLGMKGTVRGLGWLVGIVAYLVVLGVALKLTSSRAPAVLTIRMVLVVSGSFALWWTTPFILLCGRVRMRAVLVTGLLTAISVLIAGTVSAHVLPRIIEKNEAQFGTIGVVFAIQSWLVVMGSIVVGAAIVGALAAQARGFIGTWTRGSADPDGWRRDKPPSRLLAKVRPRPPASD